MIHIKLTVLKLLKLLIFILFPITFISGTNKFKSDIYKSFIYSDMQKWKNTINGMEQLSLKSNADILELVNYQYGYIAWCIGNKNEDEAELYLDKAEKNIQALEKRNYRLSMVNAYKAAFYGYRIGLNIFKAPLIGMKSIDCAKKAMEMDKTNAFAYMQYGNIQYYMPSMFGGSKTEAIEYYKKAYDLMSNSEERFENWNYLGLMTTLAQAYHDIGDLETAKIYLEKILNFEPEYQWVKNELYPKILKKLKK